MSVALVAISVTLFTAISAGLIMLVWGSKREFRTPFVLLLASQMLIMWSYMMDVVTPSLDGKMFLNNLEFMGYLSSAIFFFLFALHYTRDAMVSRKVIALISVPAALILLSVATNPFHHLFYVSTELSDDILRSVNVVQGPLFYIYVAYTATVLIASMAALTVHFLHALPAYRFRVGVTCLASGIGVAAVLMSFIYIPSIPGGILVALGFMSFNLLMFVGAFSFELLSMVPFGLDRVVRTSKGSAFILDENDAVIFLNPAAEVLAGSSDQACGRNLIEVLPGFPRSILSGSTPSSLEIEDVHEVVPGRFFDVAVLPIHDHAGRLSGKTVTLREVTAQRAAEAEARLANHKLDLMTSITRHDVLNQLTVIEGHLALAAVKTDSLAVKEHIAASHLAAQNIHRMMDTAREYQEMSERTPVWQDLGDKFVSASATLDLKGASLTVDTKGAEVLADRLLEKVLYNLIDNSIAHGERVKNIVFTVNRGKDGLEVVYNDDGVGVPAFIKPGLFTKGFGHHSGLGLYLSREILAHSGMTITEDGEPGRGARFVIRVPEGRFRNMANRRSGGFPRGSERASGRPDEATTAQA